MALIEKGTQCVSRQLFLFPQNPVSGEELLYIPKSAKRGKKVVLSTTRDEERSSTKLRDIRLQKSRKDNDS